MISHFPPSPFIRTSKSEGAEGKEQQKACDLARVMQCGAALLTLWKLKTLPES